MYSIVEKASLMLLPDFSPLFPAFIWEKEGGREEGKNPYNVRWVGPLSLSLWSFGSKKREGVALVGFSFSNPLLVYYGEC